MENDNQTLDVEQGINRNLVEADLISRVLNNTPISEILRVYSLALQSEISKLSDEDLFTQMKVANYDDLLAKHFPEELIKELDEEL